MGTSTRFAAGGGFRRFWPAWLVLTVSIAVVAIAGFRVRATTRARREAQFQAAIAAVNGRMDVQFNVHITILSGMRGLLASRDNVTPEEFRRYLASLELRPTRGGTPANFPWLRDLGFAMRVREGGQESHVATMRQNGFVEYAPLFLGPGPDHFPIAYLDDFRDVGMMPSGWDPSDDPERRAAMEKARDTAAPVVTGPVEIYAVDAERRTRGFLIYLAVYARGITPPTEAERRQRLIGFVFASIDGDPFWRAAEGEHNEAVQLTVFDGRKMVLSNIIYPDPHRSSRNPRKSELEDGYSADGMGRSWSFHFASRPEFEAGPERLYPQLVMAAGGLLSLGLFAMTWVRVRNRAVTERMTTELRASEAQFRGIFNAIQDLYYRSDLSGRITMISPSCRSILGHEPEAVLGERAIDAYADPAQREAAMQCLLRDGKVEDLEVNLRRKDGRITPFSLTAHLVFDAANRPIATEGILRDISHRKETELERLRSSKLESVGLLAGGIAHDFNNILTAILGNAAFLRLTSDQDAELAGPIEEIERAALRARDLTQQLLTFARGGAPVRKAASLAEIIRESAGFALRGTSVRREFDLPADLWPAEVDAGQLSQVLHNLVINAVQAMPEGGTLRIQAANETVRAETDPEVAPRPWIHCTVSDTGTGIRAEHLPKIFDPYFTTKQQGSGLGLATVYSIIRRHDGHITVESQLGQGTTFHLRLPASPGARIPAPAPTTEPGSGHGEILVVDDEAPIRTILARHLERLGYRAECVADGAEAVAAVRRAASGGRRFRAVILDLTIPGGIGGREALPLLREVDPELRAIVSSGYSNDPVMASHQAHGFDGVLAKPYNPEALARTLREVIHPPKPACGGPPAASPT